MCEHYYLSSFVLNAYGKQYANAYKTIIKEKIRGIKDLQSTLNNDEIIKLIPWCGYNEKNLRLWIDGRGKIAPLISKLKHISLEKRINSRLKSTLCNCTIEKHPSNNIIAINYSFNESCTNNKFIRSYSNIIGQIFGLIKDRITPQNIELYLDMYRPVKDIMLFFLNTVFFGDQFIFTSKENFQTPIFGIIAKK